MQIWEHIQVKSTIPSKTVLMNTLQINRLINMGICIFMVMDDKIILDKENETMNKKGRTIALIEIKTGKLMNAVTAFDEDGNLYKLTRNQRNVFLGDNYTDRDVFISAFGNTDILSSEFRVVKDGVEVYHT